MKFNIKTFMSVALVLTVIAFGAVALETQGVAAQAATNMTGMPAKTDSETVYIQIPSEDVPLAYTAAGSENISLVGDVDGTVADVTSGARLP